jgi:hypothetical protein
VKPDGTLAWTFEPRSVDPMNCIASGGVIVAGGGNVYVGYSACGPSVGAAALRSDGSLLWQAGSTPMGDEDLSAMSTEGVIYSTFTP